MWGKSHRCRPTTDIRLNPFREQPFHFKPLIFLDGSNLTGAGVAVRVRIFARRPQVQSRSGQIGEVQSVDRASGRTRGSDRSGGDGGVGLDRHRTASRTWVVRCTDNDISRRTLNNHFCGVNSNARLLFASFH
jgi:hypothetical protein